MATARGSGLTRAAKAKTAGIKTPRRESDETKKKISEALKRYYAAHPRKGHQTAAQKAAEAKAKAEQRAAKSRDKAAAKARKLSLSRAKAAAKAKAAAARKAARLAAAAERAKEREALKATRAAAKRRRQLAKAERVTAHAALMKAKAGAKVGHRVQNGSHPRGSRAAQLIRVGHRRNLKGYVHTKRRHSRARLLHKTSRHHRTHHVWRKRRRR